MAEVHERPLTICEEISVVRLASVGLLGLWLSTQAHTFKRSGRDAKYTGDSAHVRSVSADSIMASASADGNVTRRYGQRI